jgi:Ecdysteroid kinase-like family
VVSAPSDLTNEWLEQALDSGPVASFETERIGTGQMSVSHRVRIAYADGDGTGPSSVVLKVPAEDETSRQTGVALGLYEREVRFYAEVAPQLDGPLAPCFHASYDPHAGTFCLLLGDAGPAVVGDEIAGCDLDTARLAIAGLARLHAPALRDPALDARSWLERDSPIGQALLATLLAGFLERYDGHVTPPHREVCERLTASYDAYLEEQRGAGAVEGLVHGDYRLDNLLFGAAGADRPLTVVDWQTVGWGPALTDVAYFLGCALKTDDRRAHADELLALYHESLGPDAPVTPDQVREGVRAQSFFGVLMAIISPMLVERTERGDDMFMTLLARHCEQVLDLGALDVLPAPSAPAPLATDPADEHRHEPTGEPLWNESWYFDLADAEQGVGAYVRLGLTPNEGRCWYTALVCGPGRPTVAVLDFAAPLPDDDLTVTTPAFTATQRCEEELERYRVTLTGRGEAHDDPAALLRGEAGRPVDVELDLVWHTDGRPFSYRLSTRYEIPCRVDGTLIVDGERIELTGVPGQRDHSWAVRDWWGMDWVWSSGHFEDGTHIHGLDLRLPEGQRLGTGYVQSPGEPLVELQTANADERIGDDGLPLHTRLTLVPGDLVVDAQPLGHGPLRLEDDDGRVALFPRAWALLQMDDGRRGIGWIEWNRNL